MENLVLNDGTSMPMLAFGTGTAMLKRDQSDTVDRGRVETIKTAIRKGYHHLDTAQMYNTEAELGAAIKESGVPREQLFVTTKISYNFREARGAVEASLKKLQLDYVDLYLLHTPYWAKSDADLQEAWAAMEGVRASGKARSIGVSNYAEEHLRATLSKATVTPSINQIEFHPYLQQNSLLEFQKSEGIAVSAYGALAPLTRSRNGPLDAVIESLADKYNVTAGVVCLRYCLDRGVVAITTTGKETRMEEYLRAMEFRLDVAEVQEISEKGLESVGGVEPTLRVVAYHRHLDEAARKAKKENGNKH